LYSKFRNCKKYCFAWSCNNSNDFMMTSLNQFK